MIFKKPPLFIFISLGYLILVVLFKWQFKFQISEVWFAAGGIIGIFGLDIAEYYFKIKPSPFHSVVFEALLAILSLFIITSSNSPLASGLVLSLYLSILLPQLAEWRIRGSIESWMQMINGSVNSSAQRLLLIGFIALFIVETYIFIR